MTDLQQAQLEQFLRALSGRVQTIEGGAIQAVNIAKSNEAMVWDLFSQLLSHDHCELCGQAYWGSDHACKEGS